MGAVTHAIPAAGAFGRAPYGATKHARGLGHETLRVILNRADQIPNPKEGGGGDGTTALRSATLAPQSPRLDREADLGQGEEQVRRIRIPRGRAEHLKGGVLLL